MGFESLLPDRHAALDVGKLLFQVPTLLVGLPPKKARFLDNLSDERPAPFHGENAIGKVFEQSALKFLDRKTVPGTRSLS